MKYVCLAAIAATLAATLPAAAQLRGARAEAFARQTALMDSRLSNQYSHSDRLRPVVPESPAAAASERVARYDGSQRSQWIDHARAAARRHGIPEDLFLRLVRQESGWNPGSTRDAW